MVRPGAGIRERLELAVCFDKPDYCGAGAGLDLPKCYFTDHLVALVAPGIDISREGRSNEQRRSEWKLAHRPLRSVEGSLRAHPVCACENCHIFFAHLRSDSLGSTRGASSRPRIGSAVMSKENAKRSALYVPLPFTTFGELRPAINRQRRQMKPLGASAASAPARACRSTTLRCEPWRT